VPYLVAFNNDTRPHTAALPGNQPGAGFHPVYTSPGAAGPPAVPVSAGPDGAVAVPVPALSTVVLAGDRPVPVPAAAPRLRLAAPDIDVLSGVATLTATPDPAGTGRVSFAAQLGTGPWVVLGTADAAPYQVTQDLSGVPAGTPVRYKAVLRDGAGRLAAATVTVSAPGPR